jgi:hypothetical protein
MTSSIARVSTVLFGAFIALSSGCGSSRPIQEEPNAPTGTKPTIPEPQGGEPSIGPTEKPVTPAPPPAEPESSGTPPPGSVK